MGFIWRGHAISDSTRDETGRFDVNPDVYYQEAERIPIDAACQFCKANVEIKQIGRYLEIFCAVHGLVAMQAATPPYSVARTIRLRVED